MTEEKKMNPQVASLTARLQEMTLLCIGLQSQLNEEKTHKLRNTLIDAQRMDSILPDRLACIINEYYGMCRISKPCEECPNVLAHWAYQSDIDEDEPIHPSLWCDLHNVLDDVVLGAECTCTDHCEHCTCVVPVEPISTTPTPTTT